MPLFPDELEEEQIKTYKLKVYSCSVCPFSIEIIDEEGDYLGNKCEISDCQYSIKDDILIPENCPLRKQNINIKTELKEKQNGK